ncbi:FAD-dependent oxidoreductase [Eggerthella sp. NSJ-70]|uniref:FAD-dependent oxidoreductase n=1 Tax=Eggerthella hominis TaxID=2763043 RepID=A0ABR7BQT3_9ACTN|nr:FAD-dependent oxidoreductase [Eggerthella hominis]MBC5583968.1 FAD-dependent oxidoreductase [Eggerthella hominis]
MKHYDAAIIGFGKGGKTLAGALAAEGKNVAVIEQSPRMYGGTCINVACIPTKTLVHAAALSQAQGGTFAERAARYAAAIDEKDRVTGMLRGKNYHKIADLPNVDVIDGRASFVDATHLAIEPAAAADATTAATTDAAADATSAAPQQIEADRIFINTGARPFVPPIPGIDSPRVFVSETLLDLRDLPERFVIIGGGYIGLEFASLYANFGSQVTVVQDTEEFIPREDAAIAASVLASLENRGIRVVRSARVVRIDREAAQDAVVVEVAGTEERIPADAVLVATGRRPNVEGLALDAAGVELTERGAVRADEHLRTTAPNIHAMGDVVGGLQFTYISLDDFRIVKDDLLGDGARTTENRGAVPYSVFLDPPFSRVGMTEQEARDAGFVVNVAELPAAAIPKAQLLGKPVGLLKAVVDADTDRLLGVHLFCEESYEMINTAKLAIDAGLPYQTLRDAIYTHPTMSEAFNDLFAAVR